MKPNLNNLRERATALRLHGILEHWSETASADWLPGFIQWEEDARAQRSLERRIGAARIGRFKALAKNLKATVIIQHEPRDVGKLPAFPKAAE